MTNIKLFKQTYFQKIPSGETRGDEGHAAVRGEAGKPPKRGNEHQGSHVQGPADAEEHEGDQVQGLRGRH